MPFPSSGLIPTPASSAPSALSKFVSSLKRVKSVETLEKHQQRLQYLAIHLDPFSGSVDDQCIQILRFYEIEGMEQDPFFFTNVLLQMLDQLEARMNQLTPPSA